MVNIHFHVKQRLIFINVYHMRWCDMIWYMIWYDIWYDMIWYMIWYDIWYGMIYDMILYMIWYMVWYDMIYDMIYIGLQLGWHPVAAVQYTFTQKQYTENREQNILAIKKLDIHINKKFKTNLGSADRAPSLPVIPWHLTYNWEKSTENPQLG
jgi:hypothetical protein